MHCGDAQVEEGRPAADVQRPVPRIGAGHGPIRIGTQKQKALGCEETEAPRLRVVHGRGGRGFGHQRGHRLLVELDMSHGVLLVTPPAGRLPGDRD